MRNKQNSKKQETEEHYSLNDFDLGKAEVIKESMGVVPRYRGKLKMVSQPLLLRNHRVAE